MESDRDKVGAVFRVGPARSKRASEPLLEIIQDLYSVLVTHRVLCSKLDWS